ncbi:MAG TPA: hypothetical protein PK156_24940, partial [Polyangium sp.]|nr:hypothetical protein [Polyangium sp.]
DSLLAALNTYAVLGNVGAEYQEVMTQLEARAHPFEAIDASTMAPNDGQRELASLDDSVVAESVALSGVSGQAFDAAKAEFEIGARHLG